MAQLFVISSSISFPIVIFLSFLMLHTFAAAILLYSSLLLVPLFFNSQTKKGQQRAFIMCMLRLFPMKSICLRAFSLPSV